MNDDVPKPYSYFKTNEFAHAGLFSFYLINIILCLEGVAEVDGGYDEEDGGAEVLPPLEDHGMEVESEEWVERHQVPEHFVNEC